MTPGTARGERRSRASRVIALGLAAASLFVAAGCKPTVPSRLTHAAYVWQRNWSPAISHGIEQSRNTLSSYVVLIGEIGFRGTQPEFFAAHPNFSTLHRLNVPIALALRIGP